VLGPSLLEPKFFEQKLLEQINLKLDC
jgi:hypothetical protein